MKFDKKKNDSSMFGLGFFKKKKFILKFNGGDSSSQ